MLNDKLIYNIKEQKRKLIINFNSEDEIHINAVVSCKHPDVKKDIYFKVTDVCANDTIYLKVTAEEYGYGSYAGTIDIREFMKNVFVSVITDKEILNKLEKESRYL